MALLKKKAPKKAQKPKPKGVLISIFATIAAVLLLVFAALSLVGTAVAFVVSLPLFVVCSPVLVPAGITTGLLVTGLAAGGGSSVTALTIIMWLYKKITGKEPPNRLKRAAMANGASASAAGASPKGAGAASPEGGASPAAAKPGGKPSW